MNDLPCLASQTPAIEEIDCLTTIEVVIRTVACTASLLLGVAFVRASPARRLTRLFGGALCLGVIVYVACSGSPTLCSAYWWRPAWLVSAAVPFFFWGWTSSIMNDEFVLSPLALGSAGLLIVPTIVNQIVGPNWYGPLIAAHSLLGLAFVISTLVGTVRGWRQDLVESRRRLRFFVVALSGLYIVIILSVELFLGAGPPHEALLMLNAVFLCALLLGIAMSVLDVTPVARISFGWSTGPATLPVEPATVAARDREQELIDRLNQLMTHDGAYRDSTATIAVLATRLGVTEKKLRETINQRLGFKNYPSFVNAFRLEEVRRRLADPEHDPTPILSMALEAGFGSIVAFNRAFKDRYGTTPSLYRASRSE